MSWGQHNDTRDDVNRYERKYLILENENEMKDIVMYYFEYDTLSILICELWDLIKPMNGISING